jgi:hypothetical protein
VAVARLVSAKHERRTAKVADFIGGNSWHKDSQGLQRVTQAAPKSVLKI